MIFATSHPSSGLQSVPAASGNATVLTRPDTSRGEADHLWPEVLPGGRKVLFTVTTLTGGLEAAQIAVLDLDTGTRTIVLRGGSHAHYAASGHLVYAAAGTLRAVPFDLDRLVTRGTAVPVIPRVVTTLVGAADFGIADNGTLVYIDSPGFNGTDQRTLSWVDRRGMATTLPLPPRPYQLPRISPDGTHVALFAGDQDSDIWVWDLMRSTLTRLTFEVGIDTNPLWMPDGRNLVFGSLRTGGVGLYVQAADGTGAPKRLTSSNVGQNPTGISPDGIRLVFHQSYEPNGPSDLRLLTLPSFGQRTASGSTSKDDAATLVPRTLLETRFSERNGVLSPDGRWIAYEANPSGSFEVYVRPFPDVGGGQWQISTGGGRQPLWTRNGRELFFLAPGGALLSVNVEARGASWNASTPAKILDAGPLYRLGSGFAARMYDVSPDGQRFLLLKQGSNENEVPPEIVVVQHWFDELKRLAPAN